MLNQTGQLMCRDAAYQPSLNLNFLSGSLDSRITFTRATTATYFNSSGVLSTASSGVARFDYNPSTLVLNGLLIEQASTNIAFPSQGNFTSWTTTGAITITENNAASPDGTSDASTFNEGATTNIHGKFLGPLTVSSGATYTATVYAKAGTSNFMQLVVSDATALKFFFATFQLTGNGTVVFSGATSGTLVSATITPINNGFYRVHITGSVTGETAYYFSILNAQSGSSTAFPNYAGANLTFIAYGAQLEPLAFPTSYIPTTNSTVTRAHDVATINTSQFNYNSNAGTLFGQSILDFNSGTNQNIVALDDGSSANRTEIYRTGGNTPASVVQSASSGPTLTGAATWTNNAVFKLATAYATNDVALAAAGALSGTSNTYTTNTAINILRLGDSASSSRNIVGWIQQVKYWSQRLSNSQLIGLTS